MEDYGRLWKIMEDYGRLEKIMEDFRTKLEVKRYVSDKIRRRTI